MQIQHMILGTTSCRCQSSLLTAKANSLEEDEVVIFKSYTIIEIVIADNKNLHLNFFNIKHNGSFLKKLNIMDIT